MAWPFQRPGARRTPAVRTFEPADVPRLVDIWTRAYAGYAGPVVQTPESWRWRAIERPGVEPADIPVVVDDAGTPVGYGVLDPTGAVLEVAIDAAAPAAARDAAAARIVGALEARCLARGVESIRFVLPDADDAVQRALRDTGYWSEPADSFTGTIVDVAALLEVVLPPRVRAVPAGWGPTFRLDVARGPDWPVPRLVTRVEMGPPLVIAAEPPDATPAPVDCTIALTLATLNRLFLGLDTVESARAAGTLSVQPDARFADAATFLRLIPLGAPWYTPLADGR